MAISFFDLYSLDSENVVQLCQEIKESELTTEEMVAIAHHLDKISTCLRQPSRTVSENFKELVNRLLKTQKRLSYEPGWVLYRINESWDNFGNLALEDWEYLGNKLGYERGWAQYKFQEAQS